MELKTRRGAVLALVVASLWAAASGASAAQTSAPGGARKDGQVQTAPVVVAPVPRFVTFPGPVRGLTCTALPPRVPGGPVQYVCHP